MIVLTRLNINLRGGLVLACCVVLQGCVSSSLEEAAPQPSITNNLPTALDKPLVEVSTEDIAVNSNALQRQALNADIPAKYDKQGFPTFAETPRGEVDQLSSPEKIAIETKMTELLLSRTNDENVRANFEAKLKRLRELAKTHEQNADVIISQ